MLLLQYLLSSYIGKQVTGGTIKVNVKGTGFLSFVSLNKQYDLCSVVPTPCPIQAGPISIAITRKIPRSPIVS